MLHSCRTAFTAIIFLFFLLLVPKDALAAISINTATLNGSSSVTVAPSTAVSAAVTVVLTAGTNWQGTSYQIGAGSTVCVDTANHNTPGTYSESFNITAPASNGTYNVTFIAYGNNACSTGASSSFTLTGGIVVSTPTPTPTPVATPTPTPTPTPGATPAPTPTPTPGATPTPSVTPGPGVPTPTPTSISTTPTPGPSVTYYPLVSLIVYAPDPTNKVPLTFWGFAQVEQGTIATVEYSLTDGADWIPTTSADGSFNNWQEYFTFTTANLTEGTYTVKVRAKSAAGIVTQAESYASDTVTIATTPPEITLDQFSPNPTKNQTPTVTGSVLPKVVSIARVEVSIDNGKSWGSANLSGNTFSLTLAQLEDGNYPIVARVFDRLGNIGQSVTQTLIIDTIPPVIGGGMQSLGPQILTPDKTGKVGVVAGTETTIAMSMKGGVTAAEIKTDAETFQLSQKTGTTIWVGNIKFTPSPVRQEKPLTIVAVDGAGNTTERKYNSLVVENSGMVVDAKTQSGIENAEVSLYIYESISGQWLLWEAASYGQQNPQKTDSNSTYSFMVPAGKYYLMAKKAGYKNVQSEIITLPTASILNFRLPLTSKPKIEFTIPFFGRIVLTTPSFFPETFSIPKIDSKFETPTPFNATLRGPAPDFTLPAVVLLGLRSNSGEGGTKEGLTNLENEEINLAAFKGKKVLLSFIAPWSALSLEQAPFLSKAYLNLKENQELLVISLQESVATTQTLMKRGNYTFPVVADKNGVTAADYQITLLPQHVFIDTAGKIQETYTGVLTTEELLQKLANVP